MAPAGGPRRHRFDAHTGRCDHAVRAATSLLAADDSLKLPATQEKKFALVVVSDALSPLRSPRRSRAGLDVIGGTFVNRAELIDAIRTRLGVEKRTAESALDAVLDTIQRAVAQGEKVAITGFGVFEKVDRAARTGRNPRTGEAVKVKKTSVPKFRPGSQFKGVVSGAVKLGKVADAATKAAAKSTATTARSTARTAVGGPTRAAAAARSAAKKASKAPASRSGAAKKTASKSTAKKSTAKKSPAMKSTTKLTAKKTAKR